MIGSCLLPLVLLTMDLPAQAATLQVSISGIRNDHGIIDVCVFTTPAGFPNCAGNASVLSRRVPAVAGALRLAFDVPPGPCAVSVLHDENANGKLDTSLLGVPREGVGVSKNPPPRMGPPHFADAAFTVGPHGEAVIITMVYP